MSGSRDKNKLTEEECELRDKVELSEKIAFEKCRTYRDWVLFQLEKYPNLDHFIWSKKECEQASKNVVKQVEELYQFKYGSKNQSK